MKFDELPFVKVKNVEELIAAINMPNKINITEFRKIYSSYDKPDISEKICQLIIMGNNSNLKIVDILDNE